MSVIQMPNDLFIGSFSMEQVSYDMVETSDPTGDESIRLFGPPRWRVSMSGGKDMSLREAGQWEVITLSLRRGVNCLAVWDPLRIAPQGSRRGVLALAAAAAGGATSITLNSTLGTLLTGDWLQVGTGPGTSQLVKVMADVANGSGAVTFEPALRVPFASGTPVAWSRPVFYARNIGKSVKWEYQAGNMLQSGFSFDLLETFNA